MVLTLSKIFYGAALILFILALFLGGQLATIGFAAIAAGLLVS